MKKYDSPTYVSISLEKIFEGAAELAHLPRRKLRSTGVAGGVW